MLTALFCYSITGVGARVDNHKGVHMTDNNTAFIVEENAYLRKLLQGIMGSEGQPIFGLTPYKTQMVDILRNAHGRYISEDQFLDMIYFTSPNDIPLSKTIPVHLTNIRIARPDIAVCIKNQRAIGWRWVIENESHTLSEELKNRVDTASL